MAFDVCAARALTSEATTANPRPASPARAASMVALSASRFVCSATALINFTTSPIRDAAFHELDNVALGYLRLLNGLSRDPASLLHLTADFLHRRGDFFGGACD